MRKKSKSPQAKLEREVWELCKQIIRRRYGNVCYTCGRGSLAGSNWHTGHMWPKASLGASMKYDLRILRPQCYNCNINLGGNGARFYARMAQELGKRGITTLVKARDDSRAYTTKALPFYQALKVAYETVQATEKPSFLSLLRD